MSALDNTVVISCLIAFVACNSQVSPVEKTNRQLEQVEDSLGQDSQDSLVLKVKLRELAMYGLSTRQVMEAIQEVAFGSGGVHQDSLLIHEYHFWNRDGKSVWIPLGEVVYIEED